MDVGLIPRYKSVRYSKRFFWNGEINILSQYKLQCIIISNATVHQHSESNRNVQVARRHGDKVG